MAAIPIDQEPDFVREYQIILVKSEAAWDAQWTPAPHTLYIRQGENRLICRWIITEKDSRYIYANNSHSNEIKTIPIEYAELGLAEGTLITEELLRKFKIHIFKLARDKSYIYLGCYIDDCADALKQNPFYTWPWTFSHHNTGWSTSHLFPSRTSPHLSISAAAAVAILTNDILQPWVIIDGFRCIEPTGISPIEEIVLCLFHQQEKDEEKEIANYLISATFILRESTSEPTLHSLTQKNVSLTYMKKHPLIKERRPFISLLCGAQQQVVSMLQPNTLSTWGYHNFFHGVHLLTALLSAKNPLYDRLNSLFCTMEREPQPKDYSLRLEKEASFFTHPAAEGYHGENPHTRLFQFKEKVIAILQQGYKEIVSQRYIPACHRNAYGIAFFDDSGIYHDEDPGLDRAVLNLHYAIKMGNYEEARNILQDPSAQTDKILRWDAYKREPCQILIENIQNTPHTETSVHHSLELLRELLIIRKKIICQYPEYPELLYLQKAWEWAWRHHPCLTRKNVIAASSSSAPITAQPQSLIEALAAAIWRPPQIIHGTNDRQIITELLFVQIPPRSQLHEYILRYDPITFPTLEAIEKLLQENPELLDTKDIFYFTPLLLAVALGHLELVDYLIQRGAQIRIYDLDRRSYSLIHNAPHAEMLFLILRKSFDLNSMDWIQDCVNRTLTFAKKKKCYDFILLLLRYGLTWVKYKYIEDRYVTFNRTPQGQTPWSSLFPLACQGKQQAMKACDRLLLKLLDFQQEIYLGRFDQAIERQEAFPRLKQRMLEHNGYVQRLKNPPIPALRVMKIEPEMTYCEITRRKQVVGILIHYLREDGQKFKTLITSVQRLLETTDSALQDKMMQALMLFEENFRALRNGEKSELDLQTFIRDFVEISYNKAAGHPDRVVCVAIISLFTAPNIVGHHAIHYGGKLIFTDPNHGKLGFAGLTLKIPLSMKLVTPGAPCILYHKLLQPGFFWPLLRPLESHPFPMYELPSTLPSPLTESRRIFSIMEHEETMLPPDGWVPAKLAVNDPLMGRSTPTYSREQYQHAGLPASSSSHGSVFFGESPPPSQDMALATIFYLNPTSEQSLLRQMTRFGYNRDLLLQLGLLIQCMQSTLKQQTPEMPMTSQWQARL